MRSEGKKAGPPTPHLISSVMNLASIVRPSVVSWESSFKRNKCHHHLFDRSTWPPLATDRSINSLSPTSTAELIRPSSLPNSIQWHIKCINHSSMSLKSPCPRPGPLSNRINWNQVPMSDLLFVYLGLIESEPSSLSIPFHSDF